MTHSKTLHLGSNFIRIYLQMANKKCSSCEANSIEFDVSVPPSKSDTPLNKKYIAFIRIKSVDQ